MFLSELSSADAKRNAIAKLPEWRKKNIVQRAFPGASVGGMDWADALSHAGADFDVYEAPLFAHSKSGVQAEAPKHKGIVRYDNDNVVGVVGTKFGTVQHHDAFDGLRSICEGGNATLEALSVEEGGARVSATALLGFSSISQLGNSKGDALAHFLRAKNAHDGSGSYEFSLSTLRLVCLNGMTGIEHIANTKLRHTSKVHDRIRQANDAIFSVVRAAKEEVERFERLAQDRITLESFIEFGQELLNSTRGEANTDKKLVRRENDVNDLVDLFAEGAGNHGASKFDAYNAVTEWLSVRRNQYETSAKFANAFRNAETGTAAKTRTRALRLLQR